MDREVGRKFVDRTLKLMKQKYPNAMKEELPDDRSLRNTIFRKYIGFEHEVVKEYLDNPFTDPQHLPAITQEMERLTLILHWVKMCHGNYTHDTRRPLVSRSDTDVKSKDSKKPSEAHNHLKGWDERRLACNVGKIPAEYMVGPCGKGNIQKDLESCKQCGPSKTETGSLLNLHGPDPFPEHGYRDLIKQSSTRTSARVNGTIGSNCKKNKSEPKLCGSKTLGRLAHYLHSDSKKPLRRSKSVQSAASSSESQDSPCCSIGDSAKLCNDNQSSHRSGSPLCCLPSESVHTSKHSLPKCLSTVAHRLRKKS